MLIEILWTAHQRLIQLHDDAFTCCAGLEMAGAPASLCLLSVVRRPYPKSPHYSRLSLQPRLPHPSLPWGWPQSWGLRIPRWSRAGKTRCCSGNQSRNLCPWNFNDQLGLLLLDHTCWEIAMPKPFVTFSWKMDPSSRCRGLWVRGRWWQLEWQERWQQPESQLRHSKATSLCRSDNTDHRSPSRKHKRRKRHRLKQGNNH